MPEWYFLPFYAILRAITFNIGPIDSKLGGVLAMFGSIAVLFLVPWLDTSKVRSAIYRPWYKLFFWLFVADCILLGWLGSRPAEGVYVIMSQLGDALLLRVLHRHHAAARPDRDVRGGCPTRSPRRCSTKNKGGAAAHAGRRHGFPREPRAEDVMGTFGGTSEMQQILGVLAAAGLALAGASGGVSAQEDGHAAAEPTHFPILKPQRGVLVLRRPFRHL